MAATNGVGARDAAGANDARRGPRLRGQLCTVALVAAVLGLASCGSPPPQRAHGSVTVSLHLGSTRIVSGKSTAATITIDNATGRALRIPTCETDGTLTVGLSSRTIPYSPLNGAVACTTRFRVGTTTLHLTVLARYQGCGGSGDPPCVRGHGAPPLPPGQYTTAVGWLGMPRSVHPPRPIAVTVLPGATSHGM